MTTTHFDGTPNGSETTTFTPKRRQAGTTLVEILVVIVIFLIGILAVVQIFPRGFRILLTSRNNSVATALGRDMVERLKSSPDLIPEEIVPVRYSGGVPQVDTAIDPLDLAPLGDTVGASGVLSNGGDQQTTDWMLASGPNRARRVVGEGHRLPTPRQVGTLLTGSAALENYGGLLVLDHGPIDPGRNQVEPNANVVAYGNDLNRTLGAPRDSEPGEVFSANDVSGGAFVQRMKADGTFVNLTSPVAVRTPVNTGAYEAFVVDPATPAASILLPTHNLLARTYRVRMSAYLGSGTTAKRYDYLSLSIRVPRVKSVAATPLVRVFLADLLADTTEVANGNTMFAVEPDTVRVAPQYVPVLSWTTQDSLGTQSGDYTPLDPFEMKIVDRNLGVLLFSPAARESVVSRPGGVEEPLLARVDYDVRDWRIIKEDFRVVDGSLTFPLSLQSLKVGANAAPDGLNNGGLFTANRGSATDGNPYDPVPSPRDNVVLVDLTTGFEVQKYRTDTKVGDRTAADVTTGANAANDVLFTVDKSRGSVTLRDADTTVPGTNVRLIPPSGAPILVDAANRTFRVLYRARQEWAVQIFKGASQYTLVNSLAAPLAPDQALVGGVTDGRRDRIYFPRSEAGHKVTIDRIAFADKNGVERVLEGQDFIIRSPKVGDVPDLPYADLTDAVSSDLGPVFSYRYGVPVRGIKGASLSVRVLWNPETFALTSDAATNRSRIEVWGRGWRRSTTETYLRAEETR